MLVSWSNRTLSSSSLMASRSSGAPAFAARAPRLQCSLQCHQGLILRCQRALRTMQTTFGHIGKM